jgi:transposase-like protein
MVKCEICENEIEKTFLDKLDGTILKTGEGETSKKHYVCSKCQKEFKEKIKEKVY